MPSFRSAAEHCASAPSRARISMHQTYRVMDHARLMAGCATYFQRGYFKLYGPKLIRGSHSAISGKPISSAVITTMAMKKGTVPWKTSAIVPSRRTA